MERCRCSQPVGTTHSINCPLSGRVAVGNMIPAEGHRPRATGKGRGSPPTTGGSGFRCPPELPPLPPKKKGGSLSFTLATQIGLHTTIERLMYEEDQEVLHVVPHTIHPGSTRNLYPLNVEEYKIIHRARH